MLKKLFADIINKCGYEITKISHIQRAKDLYLIPPGYIELSAKDNEKPVLIDDLPLKYGSSFVVCGTSPINSVRLYVESRTILFDGDQRIEFLQCGSCKSENTFAEKELFTEDNYDFLPILSDNGTWLIFRRRNRVTSGYRQTSKNVWGPMNLKLCRPRNALVLESWAQIARCSSAGTPIILRTEMAHSGTGLRAIIEAPVKTMNIYPDKQKYQVDTGPICLPDLSRRNNPEINCLKMAFIAFSKPHFADFIIEEPTSVTKDGQECCKVFHYSTRIRLPANNVLLALEDV